MVVVLEERSMLLCTLVRHAPQCGSSNPQFTVSKHNSVERLSFRGPTSDGSLDSWFRGLGTRMSCHDPRLRFMDRVDMA
jgi:hypothetical protein